MRARSEKRESEKEPYLWFRSQKLAAHPRCQVGPLFAAAGLHRGVCQGTSTELHHLRKLGDGGARLSDENTLASCRACNQLVENEAGDARDVPGAVIRSNDPRYEAMGERAHRMRDLDDPTARWGPYEPW